MWKANYFRATLGALVFAALQLAAVFTFDLDLFELVLIPLEKLEAYELDEIVLVLLIVGAGLLFDLAAARARQQRHLEVQEQRLRVLKATMRTVHDIFNNFLQNLQLFEREARSSEALSAASQEHLGELITRTAHQLRRLGDLEDTPEIEMAGAIGIDLEGTPSPTEIN